MLNVLILSYMSHDKLVNLASKHKFMVAYSGGMDSHVLLHKFSQLGYQIRAVHVHHGLSENADSWAEHCRKVCEDLNVECIVKSIKIPNNTKHSIEALARELRIRNLQNY